MADKPTNGTVVAFGNTPQAKDDTLANLGNEDTSGIIYLDVMGNDLGGNGKALWSIDDGISEGGSRPVDLLTRDAVGAAGTTALGAQIWITADGKVAYQSTAALRAAWQSLDVGQTVTDSFTYAIQMGNGALSWAQANVVLAGTNDVPVVQNVSIAALEDGPAVPGSFIGDDIDSDDDAASLTYNITAQPSVGTLTKSGTSFTYAPGTNFQALAAGETATLDFAYTATDKHGATSTPATGTITVTGVNDAPVITAAVASGTLQEDTTLTASGQISASDVDNGATQAWSVVGSGSGSYGAMTVDGTGKWTYALNNGSNGNAGIVQNLAAGQSVTDTFTIRVDDSKGGTADQVVTVTIAGTNDAPVITSNSAAAAGAVQEDLTLSASGQLAAADIDNGATQAWSVVGASAGTYGTIAVDNSGKWTYTLNNGTDGVAGVVQSLAAGQSETESFTLRVADGQGGSADQVVTVVVKGTNDAAVIGSQAKTLTETDLAQGIGDALTVADIDSAQTLQPQTNVDGAYGTFSVAADGSWTYMMKDAQDGFVEGQTYIDKFAVTSADGTTRADAVTVTIVGTNDAPTLAPGALTTNEDSSASVGLVGNDVDFDNDPNDLIYSVAPPSKGTAATSGSTLTFNPGNDFQYLAAGENATLDLQTQATDAHGATANSKVTVTVTGVNDAPVITGGDPNGAVTAMPGVAALTVQQWINFPGGDYSLANIRNYTSSNAPSYTVTSNVIDYTDDPDGFAGQIPGSTPWPAAAATGASGTGASVNNTFVARITGQLVVASADTYTFQTYNDDGVYLYVNNQLIINDATQHPEQVYTGSIALAPGVYPIELFFFENGGEASLEFTYRNSTGTFTHVNPGKLTDSGVIQFSDVDLIDAHSVAVTSSGPTVGALTATVATDTTGSGVGGTVGWNFSVDNKAVAYLGAGESVTSTYTVSVNDNKGGTAQQTVAVIVNGVNDQPVITTTTDQAKGNTMEDTVLAVSGQVDISDPDVNDTHTWSIAGQTSGVYGSASVDGSGKWTYTVNNGTNGVASAVQSLSQGQTVIETFTVRASDGKGGNADQVVHVVVAGINDAAVISSQSKTITETNAPESVSGTLTVQDIDSAESFNAQTLAGQYGNLTLAANGAWTYAMNGPHNEFELGKNYVDTFTVSSADGTTKADAITITIAGSSDGPTAVDDNAALNASAVVADNSNVVYWVDWKTVEITGARVGDPVNGDAPVKVTGEITLGDGHTIGVTYEGLAFLVQANEQKYVYNGAGLNTYQWTEPNASNLPYTSSQVNAPPTTKDIIGLNEAFTGGGFLSANPARTDYSPRNVTFSEPVDNLFFAVLSMNVNGYKLDQNFQIVSQGQGEYGSQEPEISPTNFGNGQYGIVATGEFHGVLKLDGSVDHITWVSQNKETWNGFTVGTYGKAQTATAAGNVLANDVKGDPLSLLEVANVDGSTMVGNSVTLTLASGATLKVDRDGDYFYDDKGKFASLLSGQSHTETVTYTVKDNAGYTDTGMLTIVVNGVNDAPVARPDSATVAEDSSVTVNVLGNDSDPDGPALSVSAVTAAANGVAQIVGNSIKYTPNANFSGTDTFNYTVVDPTGLSSTAAVTVSVSGVNDAPSIAFKPLLANGSFEQPGGLTGGYFTGGSSALTGWTVTGTDVDYIKTLWPAAEGSFSLDLNGFDGGGVKQTLSTVSGQTYTIGFELSQNHLATSSTVRVAAGSTVKDYVYVTDSTTTDMHWQGQTFTFTATSDSTELSFTSLNSGANGPALDNVVSVATHENTSTVVRGLSVADLDAGTNPINVQLSVAHGTLALNSVAGLVALDSNGSDGTISYAGPQASINAALASGIVYAPTANYSGADALVATVNDAGWTGGGNLSATTNIGISVYEVALPQPISFWLADGNATDSIAPANNGTLNGGMGFAAGRNGGQAFDFDGVNDYVAISRELTNDFTVFGWMKTTQVAPAGTQFFHGDGLVYADVGGVNNDFGISQVGTKIAFGTGNPDTSILSTSDVNTGNWVQFAAVRSGSTLSLWINGVLENSIDTGNSGALATPPNIIFGANTIDNRYFQGQMDDVQFYDHALTPVEVIGVMNLNPV